jgi:hypothetical protein
MNTLILRYLRSFCFPTVAFLALVSCDAAASKACTVFVLTDGKHTRFFNNEDFVNPNTRIWFIPKGQGHFGCAYVGYDDGEAQGGINSDGLAFDWVTVDTDSYEVDPSYVPANNLSKLNGSSSQHMLEQCKTVQEAIKFYQTYREPAFAKTTLVIVDKSGASVIIGSKKGQLYFSTSQESIGLGVGQATFQKMYDAEATHSNEGELILNQCVARGNGGTKYSNSYDLQTGDIVFYQFQAQKFTQVTFNLSKELEKGAHYYETTPSALRTQQPIRPLLLNMNRHVLFINQPLADQEPEIAAKIKNLFGEVTEGVLKYDDLTYQFATDLRKNEAGIKSMLERLGQLNSLSLIYKSNTPEFSDYSYVMKFDNATILWQFLLDDNKQIKGFNTLGAFWVQ